MNTIKRHKEKNQHCKIHVRVENYNVAALLKQTFSSIKNIIVKILSYYKTMLFIQECSQRKTNEKFDPWQNTDSRVS